MRFDVDQIDAVIGRLTAYWATTKQKMWKTDDLYHLRYHDIRVPPDIEVHIPSTAPRIIDTAANGITTDSIIVSVEADGPSADAHKRAMSLQRMHAAHVSLMQEAFEVPLARQFVIDSLLRGAHCWKVLPSETGMAGGQAPLRKLWVMRAIDPINLLIPPGAIYPLPFVVEIQQKYYNEVVLDERYSDFTSRPGNERYDPQRIIKFEEIWTDEQHVVRLDGFVAVNEDNPLGEVPYFINYSGLGRLDYTGSPITLCRGLLDTIESELRGEVRGRTAIDALWQFTAFPTLITPEDPAKVRNKLDGGPARIVQGNRQEVGWLENPTPPASLARFLDDIQASITKSTFSPAFSGQPSGIDNGYQEALQIGRSRLFLSPVTQSVRLTIQHGLSFMARMIEKFDIQFTVFDTTTKASVARTIHGAKDIQGHYDVEVSIEATDPVENDRKALAGAKLQEQNLISRRRAMEKYIGVEDADEEEAQILAEMMVQRAIASGALDAVIGQAIGVDIQAQDEKAAASKRAKSSGAVRDQAIRRLQRLGPTGEVDSREAMGLPPMAGRS